MFDCQTRVPLLAVGGHRADGTPFQLAFRPPCRKWTCPDCRKVRDKIVARHFLAKAGAHRAVWTATLPTEPETSRRVQNAWARRGAGGRLNIRLADQRTIYVSSTNFLAGGSGSVGGRSIEPNAIQKLLRDPATPITGVRFVRDWSVQRTPPGTRLYRLALVKSQVTMFLDWSGMSMADLDGDGTATLEEVYKKADEWRHLWLNES